MADNQKTIAGEKTLSGVGLHTGRRVEVRLKPAQPNTGFVFVRTDLEGTPSVEALANYVCDTERATSLEKRGVRIHTTEHILAALVGMDLDNVCIELDGPELPIMDGSAKYFTRAVESAGLREQELERVYHTIKEVVSYTQPETGSEIIAMPFDRYQVTTMVDFGTKVLGTQNATLADLRDFKTEIANARTFSFLSELEKLLDAGLIKGGDLNNAIIYIDKEISPETEEKLKHIFKRDSISIKPNGILDNLTLRYPNEAARHKLLDVLGDLALAGRRIKAKVIATKPGHFVNTQFARKLQKHIEMARRTIVPEYDLSVSPFMDIDDIMAKLPHRPPFLLVDRVIEMGDNHIVGLKNVTMNEPFFQGHFPGVPLMPGVLQIEAMAQVGGILALSQVEDPENYLTYFMKIDKVRFKQKVFPGDTLIFKLELVSPIRRGICHMQGRGYVGEKQVVEAELMAQITKEK